MFAVEPQVLSEDCDERRKANSLPKLRSGTAKRAREKNAHLLRVSALRIAIRPLA